MMDHAMRLLAIFFRTGFWKWALILLAPCLLFLALLLGVQSLGRWTRSGIDSAQRFQASFLDIHCAAPPHLDREKFLAEVQVLSRFPEHFSLLADDTPSRLRRAFGQHPWVRAVQQVHLIPGGKIHVVLQFRTPTLAVDVAGKRWVVDEQGVLLPEMAETTDLPVYVSPVAPPRGGPGTEWGDASLLDAVRTVVFLGEDKELPRFASVQRYVSGLVFTTAEGSRVYWGQPVSHQATAFRKRDRLRSLCKEGGGLDHSATGIHDLTAQDQP